MELLHNVQKLKLSLLNYLLKNGDTSLEKLSTLNNVSRQRENQQEHSYILHRLEFPQRTSIYNTNQQERPRLHRVKAHNAILVTRNSSVASWLANMWRPWQLALHHQMSVKLGNNKNNSTGTADHCVTNEHRLFFFFK